MANGDLYQFKVPGIDDMGTSTLNQKAAWDGIWNNCRAQISAVAAEALDNATGAGLDERTVEYQRKSQLYSQNVGDQGTALRTIGQIATETNAGMVRAIGGGPR